MTIHAQRTAYDPVDGFLYYVTFKPNLEIGVEDVRAEQDEVEVAVSLTETGDLADLSFIVPKHLRSEHALLFLCGEELGKYVEPRIFVALPGKSGDTVASVPGQLELDLAGRIVGMVLRWVPTSAAPA
jgi:hypothetical protein